MLRFVRFNIFERPAINTSIDCFFSQAREALAENLRIGREKTQKTAGAGEDGSSEDEEDATEDPETSSPPTAVPVDSDNPWMSAETALASAAETYGGYDKFWTEQEEAKRRLKEAERKEEGEEDKEEEEEEEDRPAPRVTAADIEAESESDDDVEPEVAEQEDQQATKGKKMLKRKADRQAEGKKKTKVKKLKKDLAKMQDIDGIFDSYEKAIAKKTKKTLKKLTKGDDAATGKKLKKKKVTKKTKKTKTGSDEDEPPPRDESEKMDVSSERRATMEDLEDLVGEKAAPQPSTEDLLGEAEPSSTPGSGPGSGSGPAAVAARSAPELDPAKFMAVEPRRLRSLRPEADDAGGDDALDDADDARMTMAEAFADDDVVAEFRWVMRLGRGCRYSLWMGRDVNECWLAKSSGCCRCNRNYQVFHSSVDLIMQH